MKALIKCHLSYIISKTTVIIILILLVIQLFSSIIIANNASFSIYSQNNYFYFQNTFLLLKILSVFFGIFIFSYSFLNKQDNYSILILTSNISRNKYFISKMIVLNLLMLIILYTEMFVYVVVGKLLIVNFVIKSNELYLFVDLFFIVIYYSNLSLLFVQMTNNIYVVFISITLFIVSSVLTDNNYHIKGLDVLLPNVVENIYFIDNEIIKIMFLITFIFTLNLIKFSRKDIIV